MPERYEFVEDSRWGYCGFIYDNKKIETIANIIGEEYMEKMEYAVADVSTEKARAREKVLKEMGLAIDYSMGVRVHNGYTVQWGRIKQ